MRCKSTLIKNALCFVVASAMMVSAIPAVRVDAAKKNGWIKQGGYKYYYSNGVKATGFRNIDGYTYYFSKKAHGKAPKGVAIKGWHKIKGSYYYFDRTKGFMARGKKVDGIKVELDGTADETSYAVSKIETMMRARKLVKNITKPTDSRKTKRKKVFKYMTKVPYIGYHFLKNVRDQKDWDIIMANDVLDENAHATNGGECTAMACALGYLLHECGYKTVYITDDDSSLYGDAHSWVEIDGKAFDPLFARTKGWNNYYNASYNHNGSGANLWAINRRNVSTGKDNE